MKQNEKTIKRAIKSLQLLQQNSRDIMINRMAYTMSELLRWTIEDTDWENPKGQCLSNSKHLKEELREDKDSK